MRQGTHLRVSVWPCVQTIALLLRTLVDMNSISHYIRQAHETQSSDVQERIDRHRERALKHSAEADRLMRRGDVRQATMHANIARTHTQSAVVLESSPR